ncbi:MAG: 2TM domain-containing protein [Rhodoferax sp.]|nr:2TM domain-containing protein [Rhodoferax sp.]
MTTNNTPMSPEEIDRLARKRAGAKLGWYFHAAVYVIVNLFVFAMSQYAFGNRSWSVFPLLGWGLGLALHGLSVWLIGAGGELRERMVQKERERLQRDQDRRNGI